MSFRPAQDAKKEPPQKSGLYKGPEEALKKVSEEYEYWSGKLTETALQMCYALIAANWLVFGSVNGILQSIWAKLSLLMVLLALGANVIAALMLSQKLRARIGYGEGNLDRWATEYKENLGKDVSWPFTDEIDSIGCWMRRLKGWFTILSGVCLIIGAIVKSMEATLPK